MSRREDIIKEFVAIINYNDKPTKFLEDLLAGLSDEFLEAKMREVEKRRNEVAQEIIQHYCGGSK